MAGIPFGVASTESEKKQTTQLPGAGEIEALIAAHGDNPQYDDAVRQQVMASMFFALGTPAQLLHCEVPVAGTTITVLPVFTNLEHVRATRRLNPPMQSLHILVMDGGVVLLDLAPHEWLGINPSSSANAKLLPPGSVQHASPE